MLKLPSITQAFSKSCFVQPSCGIVFEEGRKMELDLQVLWTRWWQTRFYQKPEWETRNKQANVPANAIPREFMEVQ